jgi:hypothetical protein
MPNFKPALISAVGQGNTIDVFAVSLEVNFAGGLIVTMHFDQGVPKGGWDGWSIVPLEPAGYPRSAPAALPSNKYSTNPVFASQISGINLIAQNFSQAPTQPLLPNSTSGPAAAWRSDGGISAMAVVESQYLYHQEYDIKSETWSEWMTVGGFQAVVNRPPAMLSRANDRIDVFTLGRDSKLNTDRAMLWTFGTQWVPKGGVPANGIW